MRKEIQSKILRGKVGMRAWNNKKKLRKGGKLTRLCWEEMRDKAKEGRVMG